MNSSTSVAALANLEGLVEAALRASDAAAAWQRVAQARTQAHDPRDVALVHFLAGRCGFVAGDLANGLSHALAAVDAYESLADAAWLARAHGLAARCLLASGDGNSALQHALNAQACAEEADLQPHAHPHLPPTPSHARLAALFALANVYFSLGQLDTARDYCEQAVVCAIGAHDRIAQGAAIDTLACVHDALATRARALGLLGEAEAMQREALRCSAQAVQIAREQGHLAYEATALNNMVEWSLSLGEAPAALEMLETWAHNNPVRLPRVELHYLESRGRICLALGLSEQARALFEQVLSAADVAEAELSVVEHLSRACEACGDYRSALAHYRHFHTLHVELAAAAAQRSAQVAAIRMDTERTRERAAALSRDNVQLQQQANALHRQSGEDPLTGLANRRRLGELLQSGHADSAAAMIDIDHFKQINDRFSHAVGDAVLCQMAQLLREGCRSVDTPVRWGGEEFLVILPRMAAADAAAAAERLRARIEGFDWSVLAPGLAVTASIGVAMADETGSETASEGAVAQGASSTGDAAAAWLDRADRRLYAAKRAGRNRVVSR